MEILFKVIEIPVINFVVTHERNLSLSRINARSFSQIKESLLSLRSVPDNYSRVKVRVTFGNIYIYIYIYVETRIRNLCYYCSRGIIIRLITRNMSIMHAYNDLVTFGNVSLYLSTVITFCTNF